MLTAEEMFPEKARHRELVGLLTQIRDRLPDPDADTVTLRREDMEAVLNHGVLSTSQRAEAIYRVRDALGWDQ